MCHVPSPLLHGDEASLGLGISTHLPELGSSENSRPRYLEMVFEWLPEKLESKLRFCCRCWNSFAPSSPQYLGAPPTILLWSCHQFIYSREKKTDSSVPGPGDASVKDVGEVRILVTVLGGERGTVTSPTLTVVIVIVATTASIEHLLCAVTVRTYPI